jgi:hypothetical protein
LRHHDLAKFRSGRSIALELIDADVAVKVDKVFEVGNRES